ncbi:MAG: 2-amino-4-hydroxy-6-hydroxymethyldihydropteridine diphosphokinase [Phycisphaerales bacterium]|nr:2-amino-4-hydroxy-6-hydroxymethyldihydropteridine diphosphokinase [Phycisphaerales bacterium]MCI0631443.1 2-amino-4-hydroxy-6-hydroxymethyldihydropteridine diphosphokinase [Phycisphaerales bacterium]MCI0676598.1 2-amino-4-hydroxy-6-hydroxymethyldihydropteridine diphosphokinase [Phycisphaerales bacterium]
MSRPTVQKTRSSSPAPRRGDRATAYIALGSNLGDRKANIQSALEELRRTPRVEVVAVSSMMQTEPVGPPGQGMYLNAAARLATSLSPRQLLEACLAIERTHGRDRRVEQKWGPRVLDIDLLLFDQLVMDEPGLCVPHPRMAERWFVLAPLAEIAAQVLHPVKQETIKDLLNRVSGHDKME